MQANEFFAAFAAKVSTDPSTYFADYLRVKQQVDTSGAIYQGQPVDFLYQPMFFTEADITRFRTLTADLTGILKKVTAEYLRSSEFRKLFGFSRLMEELLLIDPGYDLSFPMARFDVFYPYNDDYMFCELNADGSSSMNESTVLREIFLRSKALEGITDDCHVTDFELIDSWIDSILSDYRKFAGAKEEHPNIAIMDFAGEGIVSEFEVFQRRFRERGYQAVICDPRQLRYRSGVLTYNDQRIDLIYRRAITARIAEEADQVTDFLQAYKDGAVCVVGGLVSQIIHNKVIFAVLHSDKCLSLLTDAEKEFVKRHIPYTVKVDPDDADLKTQIKERKDGWVLKPLDKYAGHGVYIGRDYSPKQWEELVDQVEKDTYLLQEFCRVPQLSMATAENGGLHFEKYNYLIGLFMYNEVFSGLYTRAGRKNVIASVAESYSLPNFVVNPS